jgi:hypothetical protein
MHILADNLVEEERTLQIILKILFKYFFHLLKIFLLMYNNCTGEFIVIFPYMCTMYPGLVPSLHYSQKENKFVSLSLALLRMELTLMLSMYIVSPQK